MIYLAILLITMLGEVSAVQMVSKRPEQTTCRGLGGLPEWGAKLTGNRHVRFTIDASRVDTCTEYFDLEFVADLLNSKGTPIAIRRFAAPGTTINGPTVRSFDFSIPYDGVAKVKGRALRCKKRKLGGLPEDPKPDRDDPVVEEARAIAKSFETEKKSYDEWLDVGEPEYFEVYVLGTKEMMCRSGSLEKTGRQGDSSTCSDVIRTAEELARKKYEQFGDPILGEHEK